MQDCKPVMTCVPGVAHGSTCPCCTAAEDAVQMADVGHDDDLENAMAAMVRNNMLKDCNYNHHLSWGTALACQAWKSMV